MSIRDTVLLKETVELVRQLSSRVEALEKRTESEDIKKLKGEIQALKMRMGKGG